MASPGSIEASALLSRCRVPKSGHDRHHDEDDDCGVYETDSTCVYETDSSTGASSIASSSGASSINGSDGNIGSSRRRTSSTYYDHV